MSLASLDLIRAREAAQRLLEHLGLEAYLFEVEPRAEDWRLTVECEAGEGWFTHSLPLDKEQLIASAADAEIYRHLLEEWRQRLAACRARR